MKTYLVWKNEIIDEFPTMKEARSMMSEYNMAFGGGVRTTSKPSKRLLAEWGDSASTDNDAGNPVGFPND